MITATVDVNCINVNEHESLDIIYNLNRDGKIKLYKTDTADLEIIYGNPNTSNKERLGKSESLPEDKGAFVVGHSRTGHAKVGSDRTIHRLRKSKELPEDQGVGLWGHFRWGHGKWGGNEDSYVNKIKKLLFPDIEKMNEKKKRNALRDCIHLSTHIVHERDYFITTDKTILKNKDGLNKQVKVIVIHPDDFVQLETVKVLVETDKQNPESS